MIDVAIRETAMAAMETRAVKVTAPKLKGLMKLEEAKQTSLMMKIVKTLMLLRQRRETMDVAEVVDGHAQ